MNVKRSLMRFIAANEYVVNTLKVLADNRHLSYIEDVFRAFQSLYNAHYNQDFAIVESTYELSEDELSRIEQLIRIKHIYLE